MMLRTYGWGSQITASRFWAKRSVWWFISLAVILNSLFKRMNEAFSTHSTKRHLLPKPALAKTKNVSNLVGLIQQLILTGNGRSKPSLPGIFNEQLRQKSLFGCSIKPAHSPLTSTCPLAPPLFESRRLITNWRDEMRANMLKMSFLPFLMV